MRQLKNCKKGHFVKYNGVLYRIDCFLDRSYDTRAVLVEVKDGPEHVIAPSVTEKVEYLGDRVEYENGNFRVIKHGSKIF